MFLTALPPPLPHLYTALNSGQCSNLFFLLFFRIRTSDPGGPKTYDPVHCKKYCNKGSCQRSIKIFKYNLRFTLWPVNYWWSLLGALTDIYLFYEKVPYLSSRLPRGAGLPGAANWGSLFSRSSEARLPRSDVEPCADLEPFFSSPGVEKEKNFSNWQLFCPIPICLW